MKHIYFAVLLNISFLSYPANSELCVTKTEYTTNSKENYEKITIYGSYGNTSFTALLEFDESFGDRYHFEYTAMGAKSSHGNPIETLEHLPKDPKDFQQKLLAILYQKSDKKKQKR